jgi:hypothetical protein
VKMLLWTIWAPHYMDFTPRSELFASKQKT